MEFTNLEDHIDGPIKKCVAGMALLGFKPTMSCCGFSYKGEKVPKKHLEKAYMFLSYPFVDTFKNELLVKLCWNSGWYFNFVSRQSSVIDFYANTWTQPKHPWNDKNCPHYYESFVLAIKALEDSICSERGMFLDKAEIIDGNTMYKQEVSKWWQYEPCKPWIVTPEIFDSL